MDSSLGHGGYPVFGPRFLGFLSRIAWPFLSCPIGPSDHEFWFSVGETKLPGLMMCMSQWAQCAVPSFGNKKVRLAEAISLRRL